VLGSSVIRKAVEKLAGKQFSRPKNRGKRRRGRGKSTWNQVKQLYRLQCYPRLREREKEGDKGGNNKQPHRKKNRGKRSRKKRNMAPPFKRHLGGRKLGKEGGKSQKKRLGDNQMQQDTSKRLSEAGNPARGGKSERGRRGTPSLW